MDTGSVVGTAEPARTALERAFSAIGELHHAQLDRFGRDELLAFGRDLEALSRVGYAAQITDVEAVQDAGAGRTGLPLHPGPAQAYPAPGPRRRRRRQGAAGRGTGPPDRSP
jgi:hypothetical protein